MEGSLSEAQASPALPLAEGWKSGPCQACRFVDQLSKTIAIFTVNAMPDNLNAQQLQASWGACAPRAHAHAGSD